MGVGKRVIQRAMMMGASEVSPGVMVIPEKGKGGMERGNTKGRRPRVSTVEVEDTLPLGIAQVGNTGIQNKGTVKIIPILPFTEVWNTVAGAMTAEKVSS